MWSESKQAQDYVRVCIYNSIENWLNCLRGCWLGYLFTLFTEFTWHIIILLFYFLVHTILFSCKTQFFSTQIFKIAKNKLTVVFFPGGFPLTPLFTGRYSITPKPPEGASVKDALGAFDVHNGPESISSHFNNCLWSVDFQFCMNISYTIDSL